MAGKWHRWLGSAWILAFLSAGCGSPPTFTIETVIHPDGSCDRVISQPRGEFLPTEAFKPEWVARWQSVTDMKGPPAPPGSGARAGNEKYFTARGTFRNPQEIPAHYRYAEDDAPDVGASELRRTYERNDYGFIVEHRWGETITNIVTLPGFLEARDKLLDQLLPQVIEGLEKEFGPTYDLSGLAAFLRTDVRRALEEASLILYDAAARHRAMRDDSTLDPELLGRLAAVSRRLGFDPLNPKGELDSHEEIDRRSLEYLRSVLLQRVRRRDGKPLDRSEVDALIARSRTDPTFLKTDEAKDEALKRKVVPLILRMTGVYSFPLAFLFRGGPRYDFALRLPGQVIESNGTVFKDGQTRWRFTSDILFPNGFEMKARSFDIDREGQRKILGRVAIDDEEKALKFLEIIGDDGALLEAVRKLKETGDRGALAEQKGRSYAQNQRAARLREMLFGR